METQPLPRENKSRLERLNEERRVVQREVRTRMAGAITGALGIVAGIAWNDAVRALIDYLYPASKGSDIFPKFLYALIITIIVSVVVYFVTKVLSEKKP